MKKGQTLSFLGTTLGIAILGGIILASTSSYADVVSQVTIGVPVACTMSGTGMTSHNAEIQNGTSNSSIGETTIKAFCNDSDGFTIYAIGYTNNEEGNNTLTNSTLGSTYNITTGTVTSGNASKWAMKLSTISSPTPTYPITIQNSFDSFHNVPDDYVLVAKRTLGTDVGTNAEGSTIKTTYQVYIAQSQPAGTYTGQVKYTLIHPNTADAPEKPYACPANYICYHPNGNDVVGTMDVSIDTSTYYYEYEGHNDAIGRQPAASNTSVDLVSPNYSRSGYGFAAWNTSPDGTGTNYGPNQTITTGDLSSRGLNLYAKWIPAEANVTMQAFDPTASPYGTASIGTVIALRDARDNDVYAISKLADGKWWMIENLRLDLGTASITAANTNNPSSTFLQQIQNVSPSDAWCDDDDDISCTDQILYNTSSLNRAIDPSPYDITYPYENTQWYSYGIVYNWYTATASHMTLDYYQTGNYAISYPTPNDGNSYRPTPRSPGDICPSGWNIPTAFSNTNYTMAESWAEPDPGSYQYLFNQLGGHPIAYTTSRAYPNNFILGGYYDPEDTSRRNLGDMGGWWTSTVNHIGDNFVNGYFLRSNDTLGSGGLSVNNGYKTQGYAVRCVAQ